VVAARALDGVAAERFLIATHSARQRYFMSAQARGRGVRCGAQTGADESYDVMEIGAHAAATIAPEGRDRTMKPNWTIRSAPVTASESFARSAFETND
jgi:hypothetical protein